MEVALTSFPNFEKCMRFAFLCLFPLCLGSCSALQLNPSHYGKFLFKGSVTDEKGNPIANAIVKVKGWETITDEKGQWSQERVIHCGALREHSGGYEEQEVILILAESFKPGEEKWSIHHPAWFKSCNSEQTLLFKTVLKKKGSSHESKNVLD